MPVLKASMWVHGTSARVENPWDLRTTDGYQTSPIGEAIHSIGRAIVYLGQDLRRATLTDRRFGWGTSFTSLPNRRNWFHFSIPTPVVLDDAHTRLARVCVLFKTGGWTRIRSIHLYDGPRVAVAFDRLALAGDHSRVIDPANNWTLDPPLYLSFGLGLSIGVEFGPSDPYHPWVWLAAAGADFLYE